MGEPAPVENKERLAGEMAEQALWLPRHGKTNNRLFTQLVVNEFVSPGLQQARLNRRLQGTLTLAVEKIPFYRDLFARLQLQPADINTPEALALLPTLTKAIVREQGEAMFNRLLPAGEKRSRAYASSGSTGEPIVIRQTSTTRQVRTLLTQRQLRWYRFNPLSDLYAIRGARILPRTGGRKLAVGETLSLPRWAGTLGRRFVTGRFLGFAYENSLEAKVDWLEENRPGYLFSTTTSLEHLAFAFQNREKPGWMEGIRVMSEPLRPDQQALIERTFDAPVHISYGLDETGWLATRCTEGGRYHVHPENSLIEIVDAEGRPCRAGQFGRVLVTTLCNSAMPLIRYETDDIAQALEGSCQCGRTLPSFGPVIGRHSLSKNLPGETLSIVSDLRAAIYRMPRELAAPLREYQVRQSLDGNFQLYVVLASRRDARFDELLQNEFARAISSCRVPPLPSPSLKIIEALRIPRSPSKKFFHFVSDFTQSPLAKDKVELPTLNAG